jgi:hypothetical protein
MTVKFASKSTISQGLPRSSKFWDQFVTTSDYDLLSSTILTGNQASVTFSNISTTYSSTYKHLQLRIVARSDSGQQYDDSIIRFNSDSGSNYAYHAMSGTGSSVVSNAATSQTSIPVQRVAGGASTSGIFGAVIIDIPDAFSTSKNKTIKSLTGYYVSVGRVDLVSGLWMSTAAINTIFIDAVTGSNFVSGSRFSLYGIKG